jgi:hypothetical protein
MGWLFSSALCCLFIFYLLSSSFASSSSSSNSLQLLNLVSFSVLSSASSNSPLLTFTIGHDFDFSFFHQQHHKLTFDKRPDLGPICAGLTHSRASYLVGMDCFR